MLCSTAAGAGKYGNGNQRRTPVINSQPPNVRIAAAKMGHMLRIHRRNPGQKSWIIAAATPAPKTSLRNKEYKRASGGISLFGRHR
jgi:hypothetical protein